MRTNSVVFLWLLLAAGCVPKEQIVLRVIQHVTIETGLDGEPLLKGEAVFYNPNNVRMKLKEINVDVFVDDRKSAVVKQKFNSVIKPRSEFTVPLEIQLSLKDIGLLDTLFSLLGGKQYEIHFLGNIRIHVRGVPVKVPVDYIEHTRLKF
jgi:LEA14-like dessication related protein